jgi:hypothetical protein
MRSRTGGEKRRRRGEVEEAKMSRLLVKKMVDNVTVLSTVCHSNLSSEEMKRIRYFYSDMLCAKSAVLEESRVEDNKDNLC